MTHGEPKAGESHARLGRTPALAMSHGHNLLRPAIPALMRRFRNQVAP
jgi:hypothetical protein